VSPSRLKVPKDRGGAEAAARRFDRLSLWSFAFLGLPDGGRRRLSGDAPQLQSLDRRSWAHAGGDHGRFGRCRAVRRAPDDAAGVAGVIATAGCCGMVAAAFDHRRAGVVAFVVSGAVDVTAILLWLGHRSRFRPGVPPPARSRRRGTPGPATEIEPAVASDPTSGWGRSRTTVVLALGLLVFFLFAGLEISASQWLASYARHRLGLSAVGAGVCAFGFWAAVTAVRVCSPRRPSLRHPGPSRGGGPRASSRAPRSCGRR